MSAAKPLRCTLPSNITPAVVVRAQRIAVPHAEIDSVMRAMRGDFELTLERVLARGC
jgi:hypothetical protein